MVTTKYCIDIRTKSKTCRQTENCYYEVFINTSIPRAKTTKEGSPVQCFNCKVKNFANSPRRLIKPKRLIEKSKKHGPIGTSKIIFCKLNYRQAAVPPVLKGMKHGPPRGMRQSDTQICNSMLLLVCRNNISSAVGDFYVFFYFFFILVAAWIFFLYPRTLHFRICDFSSLHIDGKTEINPKIWKLNGMLYFRKNSFKPNALLQ
jgi:hypothetical protein